MQVAATVGEFPHIGIDEFAAHGGLVEGAAGDINYSNGLCCHFAIRQAEGEWRLCLAYEAGRQINLAIKPTSTTQHLGGVRWWLICPNQLCGRRVGKLYLRGEYFLCRTCHDLKYRKRVRRFDWDRI